MSIEHFGLLKRHALHEIKKRIAQMPAGMPVLNAILTECADDTKNGKSEGMKNINFGGNNNNSISNIKNLKLTTPEIIGIAVGGAVLLLSLLACCVFCFRRRAATRRRAAAAKAPKFYPEVSYLYDPPPGAPSPGPGQPLMSAQRSVPDTAYSGAAGVASGSSEKEGLLGAVPSVRSVMAPLSGYSRAGQEENPFGDQAAAQYRDSIDRRQ